ncbi:hypothetical protein PV392_24810 [Streptomyces sp. ME03-5709C]|nr:hypothetical protein [Streptomyces sp. ME03-5709C]
MNMLHADPRMAVRPARSAGALRLRYTAQWLWFPLLMALWVLPYVVVLVAYFTVLFPLAFVWGLDVPGPPGSGRRWRLRRRMWLNRKRLRRECSVDAAWLEDQFRALFDGRAPVLEGRQSSGTTWRHRDGRVEVDDSYFRQLGAGRALQIAEEYGWTAGQDGLRDLPVWLVLRRAAEPTAHSAHGRAAAGR